MDYLPLFHDLRGRRCLMVGGGETALRKLRPLLEAGARVRLVAPEIGDGVRELAAGATGELAQRTFESDDIEGVSLIIAATDDRAVNERVSRLARAANIPVNVVDNPDLCTVIFPSIVDRSPVQIAISTGGAAPVLARLLRGKIESVLPAGLGPLARLANRYRAKVKDRVGKESDRRSYWEQVFEGRIAEEAYKGNLEKADTMMAEALDTFEPRAVGEVYLVGAGPGDPDLLTFRALRLMQQADIVLYDRLVSAPVLNLVRRDAERIYVGKTAGNHPVSQENINRKLVEYARKGHRVLRLKGGDPFIFGRGGEEIDHLAENHIPFQVVPGITAASGCASYAGIPLTHRDYAQSVRFVAGHRRADKVDLDWEQLVTPDQTLVFYMGLSGLEVIAERLVAHGLDPDTPAALVEKGTTPDQRVVTGTIANLPQRVRAAEIRAPTLIIVGGVVRLRERLNWFHPDPG